MKIVMGCDHAGFRLRERLADMANRLGHVVMKVGARNEDSTDYPDAADEAVREVLAGRSDMGVLVCGTGIGMSIRANRYPGIRAAVCCSEDAAKLAISHNHANVLCLGARLIEPEGAESVFAAFIQAQPDRDERHERRVRKLDGGLVSS